MNKLQIIDRLARDSVIEEMIELLNSTETRINKQDLAQEVYLTLMEKDDRLIEDLYAKNDLRWYIQRIITNNVYSKTSPYYVKYKSFDNRTSEIKSIKESDDSEED